VIGLQVLKMVESSAKSSVFALALISIIMFQASLTVVLHF
jgi:hypothetical protein